MSDTKTTREQASRKAPDGTTQYRWYVWLADGRRAAIWSITEAAAIYKAVKGSGWKVTRIQPAPAMGAGMGER